jgi:transposase InsO family protein
MGVTASVGSTGDAYDNGMAETINGLYKTELIWKHGPWIGNVPPAEFEKTYYDRLEVLPLVAGHT